MHLTHPWRLIGAAVVMYAITFVVFYVSMGLLIESTCDLDVVGR